MSLQTFKYIETVKIDFNFSITWTESVFVTWAHVWWWWLIGLVFSIDLSWHTLTPSNTSILTWWLVGFLLLSLSKLATSWIWVKKTSLCGWSDFITDVNLDLIHFDDPRTTFLISNWASWTLKVGRMNVWSSWCVVDNIIIIFMPTFDSEFIGSHQGICWHKSSNA